MISLLEGKVLSRGISSVLIGLKGGIGVTVNIPQSYLVEKKELFLVGSEIVLHTHLKIKDDEPVVFGFLTLEERDLFLRLISITGVGVKTALSLLGNLGVEGLLKSLREGDIIRLKSVSGVGEKTAKRILLELKGELVKTPPIIPIEVEEALINMGFKKIEIMRAWQSISEKLSVLKLDSEELIKALLRVLKR